MRTNIVKYVRVESNKAIIIPKDKGIEAIKKALSSNFNNLDWHEGIETVGKVEIIAFIITFTSDIAYWHQHNHIKDDKMELYFYTEKEERIYINLPLFVEETIVAK